MQENIETQNNANNFSRSFNLKFGYQDKETPEVFHREVVISRRPTGADFVKYADEGNSSDLQFTLGLAQAAISKFGDITTPVPLTVLLSLNQIDREKIFNEYFLFLTETDIGGEILDNGKVRLGKGFERDGRNVAGLQFGKILDGYAEIEIEQSEGTTRQKDVFRMTKEIIAPDNLTVAEIESLDVGDFILLQKAEAGWLNSFRDEAE